MLKSFFLSVFVLCLFTGLSARQPYHAEVIVDGVSETISAPNLRNLSQDLKTTSLEFLIPIYTPVSPTALNINLRGIDALAFFPTNSPTLYVTIPDTGATKTFSGQTRDESIVLFKDYIHDAGDGGARLLRAYAKNSPIDPIAGNPTGLMAQMGQADYFLGHLDPLSGCSCEWSAQPVVNKVQIGMNAGRAFIHDYDASVVTMPLRYSYSSDLQQAFIIDAPITYLRNGGASSLNGSLGCAYRYPVTHDWSLTPVVRLGYGGSLDLCTSGTFFTAGLTSVYNWTFYDLVLSMTNYGAYVNSINLWMTGINFNYRLQNGMFKNGLSLTSCKGYMVHKWPVHLSISFVDTCFTGNRFFIQHYDEVGISMIATDINPCVCHDNLSLGFTYQFGEQNFRGYFLSMIYQF